MSVPLPVVMGRPAVQSGQHSGERDAVYFRRTLSQRWAWAGVPLQ